MADSEGLWQRQSSDTWDYRPVTRSMKEQYAFYRRLMGEPSPYAMTAKSYGEVAKQLDEIRLRQAEINPPPVLITKPKRFPQVPPPAMEEYLVWEKVVKEAQEAAQREAAKRAVDPKPGDLVVEVTTRATPDSLGRLLGHDDAPYAERCTYCNVEHTAGNVSAEGSCFRCGTVTKMRDVWDVTPIWPGAKVGSWLDGVGYQRWENATFMRVPWLGVTVDGTNVVIRKEPNLARIFNTVIV